MYLHFYDFAHVVCFVNSQKTEERFAVLPLHRCRAHFCWVLLGWSKKSPRSSEGPNPFLVILFFFFPFPFYSCILLELYIVGHCDFIPPLLYHIDWRFRISLSWNVLSSLSVSQINHLDHRTMCRICIDLINRQTTQ